MLPNWLTPSDFPIPLYPPEISKLYLIFSDYHATGEGRTISILVGRYFSEEECRVDFGKHFSYFGDSSKLAEGYNFPLYEIQPGNSLESNFTGAASDGWILKYIPESVLQSMREQVAAGLCWFSQFHFNFA